MGGPEVLWFANSDRRSHFLDQIIPAHLKTVLCIKPKQNTRRILAQSGAFLIFGLTSELDTTPVPDIGIERILINQSSKGQILDELDRVAVNESTMFPEIERAASYIPRGCDIACPARHRSAAQQI
jgi:hypothetical protein